ncbi:MAG: hypothetical protein EFT35_01340 [Methanophagales archaeon ANME-1-THS]|nr:MAG: hypothetical protein EFT35_01340 [Methanophagales archaeon ANME-1-THS]
MEHVAITAKAKPFGLFQLEQGIKDGTDRTPRWDDAIIDILEDEHPHSIAEIASMVNLSAEKVQHVVRFMAKYDLIRYDEECKTAVICDDFRALR